MDHGRGASLWRREVQGAGEEPRAGEEFPRHPILGLDEASAQILDEAKAMLEQRGQGLADADLFIGAIAVANRAIVVTGKRRHYERIPGVTFEDWIRR